jgi:hypothetical protein
MKKVLRYLLMTVMALCISLPCLSAEAASVALLPLINNVQGDEVANQVFYKNAIATMNKTKGFVMVENDKLTAAIEAANVGNEVPGEATMAKIAKDGGVDMVIAIQIDTINDIPQYSSEENRLKMDIQGYAASYNALTGTYKKNRIYNDSTYPEALSSRWDLVHEEFGREVRKAINKALKTK